MTGLAARLLRAEEMLSEDEGRGLQRIGIRLREARESRHLTYGDVSRVTKIPINALEAIENHDIAHLPHGIFIRGFVRTYAAEVGLDQAVVDECFAQFHTEPLPELVESPASEGIDEGRTSQLSLFVVLALAVALGLYSTLLRTPARAVAPPLPRDIAPTSGELDRADVAVPASAFAEPAEGMRLQIHLRGACVVSATTDGRAVGSRLVQPGETVRVEGRDEIVVRVTDPGACAYSIDGTSRRPRGQPDDTVIIRMGGAASENVIAGVAFRMRVSDAPVREPASDPPPSAPEPAKPTDGATPNQPPQ